MKLFKFILKEILVTNPNVKWSDIKGLSAPKKLLDEAIVLPTKYPDLFTGLCTPWTAMLFYGPPGTGKHLIIYTPINSYFIIYVLKNTQEKHCLPKR